jgi:uncharacterized protein
LNVRRFRSMPILQVRPTAGAMVTLFVAERRLDRLVGLAGLPALDQGYGLLIPRCRSVHTFGMRFALDVLFVVRCGGGFEVVECRSAVPPRRIVRASQAAHKRRGLGVIELAPGLGLCDRPAARLQPQHLLHALGQIPVPVPDQLHRRRHEHRPHDRGIEQDRH